MEADGVLNKLDRYHRAFTSYFQDKLKDVKKLYTNTLEAVTRKDFTFWHLKNMNVYNKILYSDLRYYRTLFIPKNRKLTLVKNYNNNKIIVSLCYHKHTDKI